MNKENLKIWTAALREEGRKQLRGHLGRRDEYGLSQCCLGVLCEVAGCEERTEINGDIIYDTDYYNPGVRALDFLDIGDISVMPDWGDELRDRNNVLYSQGYRPLPEDKALSSSHLNDSLKLTFSQIADIFDYFGVK